MNKWAKIWQDKYEFALRLSAQDRAAFLAWVIEYQLYDRMPEDDGSLLFGTFKMMLSTMEKSLEITSARSEAGKRGAEKRWQKNGKLMANAKQTDGEEEREEEREEEIKNKKENESVDTPTPPNSFSDSSKPKPKTQRNAKTPATDVPQVLADIPEFAEAWDGYLESRKEKKVNPTERAKMLILKKLAERPQDAVAGIDHATERSWTGFEWEWFDNAKKKSGGSIAATPTDQSKPKNWVWTKKGEKQ